MRIKRDLPLIPRDESGTAETENEINARQISTFKFHNSLFMK